MKIISQSKTLTRFISFECFLFFLFITILAFWIRLTETIWRNRINFFKRNIHKIFLPSMCVEGCPSALPGRGPRSRDFSTFLLFLVMPRVWPCDWKGLLWDSQLFTLLFTFSSSVDQRLFSEDAIFISIRVLLFAQSTLSWKECHAAKTIDSRLNLRKGLPWVFVMSSF